MANLLTYLDWRGDLTMAQAPFNEVDNLILAEISFIDFREIVPGPGEGEPVLLSEAAVRFFGEQKGKKIDMGVLVPDAIPAMLAKMAALPRFRDMRLSCYTDQLDVEKGEQFAALAVEVGDGSVYLSFRGTDDTIAGWKEDFLIGCLSVIPAQKKAVAYVKEAARRFPRRKLRLGGHSKGGNLAVYGGVFCPGWVQRRILAIYSNDGPGFHDNILKTPGHRRLQDRIHSIVPKSSVVGMLLEHEEDYTVVDSSQSGFLQHDGFSWEVLGDHFVRLREVSRQGRLNDLLLKEWVHGMSQEQRERFVDGLFAVLSASGAVTLTDLKGDRFKAAGAMVRAMADMEKDTRDALFYAVKLLFKSDLKILLEDFQAGAEKGKGAGVAKRLLKGRKKEAAG